MDPHLPTPEFGAWLRKQRQEHPHLTLEGVVRKITRHSIALEKFTRGQLTKYEKGSVMAPDPLVLHYLCGIYKVTAEEMLNQLAYSRERNARAEADHGSPPLERRTARSSRSGRP